MRQGSSPWMSTLIIGHTEKILSFNLVWGSKALLVVKGNALSTLPSSSYRRGFCLNSKMKVRQKKNNIGFLFLLYATAFKINFRRSINSLLGCFFFFLKLLSTLFISCRHRHICVYTQSWVLGSYRQPVLRWYWAAHITLASRNLYLYITTFFAKNSMYKEGLLLTTLWSCRQMQLKWWVI